MMNAIEKKLFVLSKLEGVGPKTLRAIASDLRFKEISLGDCGELHTRVASAISKDGALEQAIILAENEMKRAGDDGAVIRSFYSFPAYLAELSDMPAFLYIKGQSTFLEEGRNLAVIGTREPTSHGEVICRRLTRHFVERGWVIISGLALGCDTLAHEETLDAGGRTVAVLAHGLQTIAPRQNALLSKRILECGGALVTEYGYGTEPSPPLFVQRDRIQAAIAAGVVMIQSDHKGGSLHAARWAVNHGRLLAVPYPTVEDVNTGATKISANLTLGGNDQDAKCALLKTNINSLHQLLVLRSRDDYTVLQRELEESLAHSGNGVSRKDSNAGTTIQCELDWVAPRKD